VGLGIALKYYRIRAGVPQKELASRAGVSASYLSLVESEKRAPSLDFLTSVSRILRIPLELLMIEAKEQEGRLSPEESELFSRAKGLLLLAAKLDRRGQETYASIKSKPASVEHSKPRSSRSPTRRAPSSSPTTRQARRMALHPDAVPPEKERRKA